MISYLEGKILDKDEKLFILNAGGVGYKIYSHSGILGKIADIGGKTEIWTHLYVRENALELYGFLEKEELDFFEMLISISGIGPKSALGILETASVKNLKQAIVSEDEAFFTKMSGIGRKTAERLILELKNKLAKTVILEKGSGFRETGDAFEALVALGYAQSDIRKALNDLPKNLKTVEEKVKETLKRLGKRQ